MGLSDKRLGILFVDIQEKLFSKMFCQELLQKKLTILYEAALLLKLPMILSEQYPQGLGPTIEPLCNITPRFEKTAFSCLQDDAIRAHLLKMDIDTWAVCGIESHVCILQSVEDLLEAEKEVIIVADAISSRSALDHDIALETMRSLGAFLSTTEALLFSLLGDAKHPQFKAISRLVYTL